MLSIQTTINSLDELRAGWAKLSPEQITELQEQGLLSKLIGGEARISFRGSVAEGTAEGQVLFDARTEEGSRYEPVAAKPKRVLTVPQALVGEFLYKLMVANIAIIVEEYCGVPPFNIPTEETPEPENGN